MRAYKTFFLPYYGLGLIHEGFQQGDSNKLFFSNGTNAPQNNILVLILRGAPFLKHYKKVLIPYFTYLCRYAGFWRHSNILFVISTY